MAFKIDEQVLRSYLKLTCEYELHVLPNTKVSTAKDHGKNYMKVRPPMVRHLLRNRLLSQESNSHFGTYTIRCLLLKYQLVFLLVFLCLTRLKARQILSRLVNISACISKEGT